ncbi:glycerol-3-phosphate mitochondrial [Nannochloropsis oceanica]
MTLPPQLALLGMAASLTVADRLLSGPGSSNKDKLQQQQQQQQQQQPHLPLAARTAGCKETHSNKREQSPAEQLEDMRTTPIKCRDGTLVYPYSLPTRDDQLGRLKKESYDVLVIGGGCVGSGVALDAQVRGLKTAMVEADDFSAGTSGRSTKLIHGGIRYLETAFWKLDYGSFTLVQEALEERAHMLNAAPYMNSPLPIMIPIYKWWEVPYFWAGAKAYDLVASRQKSVPSSHFMDADEALFQFPMLRGNGLKGAIIYYDGQMNDTRMGLTIALTAAQEGATIANRVEVVSLLKDPQTGVVSGARVRDKIKGDEWEIHAKVVVNATGVFADKIRKMDNPEAIELIEPAAGVHVMFPAHFSPAKMGLIVPKTTDGRVLFFLPWEGCTLAGTTDSHSTITMTPQPTAQEVNFIMQETNRYLTTNVSANDLIAAWSGLRPLVKDPEKIREGTAALSRNHVIEVSDSGKLITITGGKWTTYRRMAEDTVDRLLAERPELLVDGAVALNSSTWNMKLLGADRARIVCDQKFNKIGITLRNDYELPEDVAAHLVKSYGTRALQVAELVRTGYTDVKAGTRMKRLHMRYPFLEAEVVFAVEQEYALKPMDILARRTRLAFLDTEATATAIPRVVKLMGDLLGWSWRQRAAETAEAVAFLETMNVNKVALLKSNKKK